MTGKAVDKIRDLKLKEDLIVDGRLFILNHYREIEEPEQKIIYTDSLEGLIDYINNRNDELYVNICSYNRVCILKGNKRKYDNLLMASFETRKIIEDLFESSIVIEKTFSEMIIFLMSHFENTEERKNLLSYASNIDTSDNVRIADDGFSQSITIKESVISKSIVTIENPIILIPILTFAEIEQPNVNFILRLEKSKMILTPIVDLKWQQEIRKKIIEYLKKNIDKTVLDKIIFV